MRSFSVIDESFDPNLTNSYYLSIRINPDALDYCTLDPIQNKYIQISHIPLKEELVLPAQIEKYFASVDILNFPYKKTFVLISSQTATLIPSGIFDSEKAGTILKFCHTIPDNNSIHYNKIKMDEFYNIFAIPQEIEAIIRRQFPEPFFVHQYTPLTDCYLSSTTSINETSYVLINLNPDFIDILVFEKERLKSCASFPVKNENDFVYFTLFTFDRLKLDKLSTPILISGTNDENLKYVKNLSNYLEKIELIDFPSSFRYGMVFKDPQIKGFYDLLYLPLCV